jgi:16S rRNA (uracil1498-N3)-methyltransferase
VPALTHRTQNSRVNVERMRANAIEAAEQCGILNIPEVDEPRKLEKLLADWPTGRLLVFCDEDAPPGDPIARLRALAADRPIPPLAVLIGPEGGFDEGERAMLAALPFVIAVSLGPRILRADTAAVAALALVQAALGDWR